MQIWIEQLFVVWAGNVEEVVKSSGKPALCKSSARVLSTTGVHRTKF